MKKRCDQCRSPASRGLPRKSIVGRFAHCHTHFHSAVELFRSGGLCRSAESPSFPHSCWKKGWSSCRDWNPRVFTPLWAAGAELAVMCCLSEHSWAPEKLLLLWAGTVQNPHANSWLVLAFNVLQVSVCLHSASVSGKGQCKDPPV